MTKEEQEKYNKLVTKLLDTLIGCGHQEAFLALSDVMLRVVVNEHENKISTLQAADIMIERIQKLRDYEAEPNLEIVT